MNEITTEEAAAILQVTPHQVTWYYRQGLLPARRFGARALMFRRADVEKFVKPTKSGPRRKKKGKG